MRSTCPVTPNRHPPKVLAPARYPTDRCFRSVVDLLSCQGTLSSCSCRTQSKAFGEISLKRVLKRLGNCSSYVHAWASPRYRLNRRPIPKTPYSVHCWPRFEPGHNDGAGHSRPEGMLDPGSEDTWTPLRAVRWKKRTSLGQLRPKNNRSEFSRMQSE
jgi:hypothetical protein